MAQRRPSNTRQRGARAGERPSRSASSRSGPQQAPTESGPLDEDQARSSRSGRTRAAGSAPRTKSIAPGDQRSASVVRTKGARMKVKGLGLRAKFMLTMSLLTGIGMLVLGISMAVTTNSFLINQAKHHGIELAKMAAQVGRAVADMQEVSERASEGGYQFSGTELKNRLSYYLQNARTWDQDTRFSFIDAVQYSSYTGGLGGSGVGQLQSGGTEAPIQARFDSIAIPGRGEVPIGRYDDIEVVKVTKRIKGQPTPVYRFRVALNMPFDREAHSGLTEDQHTAAYMPPQNNRQPYVIVDVAVDSLETVSTWLYLILIGSVVVVVGICLVVANVQARRITHPVRLLMRDMQVVAQGDLDHRSKPHSRDEVGVLAAEFDLMTQNLKLAQEAMVEQEKAEYELSIAREVQQQLLPASTPELPGYELASFYQGAKAVSGDYYDFIPLSEDMMGFIVADVSGKGIPGSMVMAVTRTIVRLVANKHQQNAAETLKETNRLIAKQIKRGMFVTAFYAVLDRRSGTLTFSSAGHNPMVIYRHQQRKIELAAPKGIAIGFNEGPLFDKNVQQFQIQLGPGDLAAIYTDGFPEAMNEDNEEFGDEEFYRRIGAYGARGAKGVIDGVLAEVTKHRGEAAQSDDLTILCLRRNE